MDITTRKRRGLLINFYPNMKYWIMTLKRVSLMSNELQPKEMSVQATQKAPSSQTLVPPKQGSLLNLVASGLLIASFFLPAFKIEGQVFYPYNFMTIKDLYLQILVPVFYGFGFTSLLLAMIGLFTSKPLPKIALVLHIMLNFLLVLGGGFVLHAALLNPLHDFSMTLLGPALLIWWPLFLQYSITWFRKRSIVWKVARSNWIASSLSLTFFSIALVSISYAAKRDVGYGLLISIVAFIVLIVGNLRNEQKKVYDGL